MLLAPCEDVIAVRSSSSPPGPPPGDRLVVVWGRLGMGMSISQVVEMLEAVVEKVTIRRRRAGAGAASGGGGGVEVEEYIGVSSGTPCSVVVLVVVVVAVAVAVGGVGGGVLGMAPWSGGSGELEWNVPYQVCKSGGSSRDDEVLVPDWAGRTDAELAADRLMYRAGISSAAAVRDVRGLWKVLNRYFLRRKDSSRCGVGILMLDQHARRPKSGNPKRRRCSPVVRDEMASSFPNDMPGVSHMHARSPTELSVYSCRIGRTGAGSFSLTCGRQCLSKHVRGIARRIVGQVGWLQ